MIGDLSAFVAGFQADAESMMTDSCRVTRSGGERTWDDATGTYTTPSATVLYEGKCRVRPRNLAVAEPDVAGRETGVLAWEVHLPVAGTGAVTRGDTVEITAAAMDPSLVGRRFTVMAPFVGSVTARRLPVEAVV